MSVIFSSNFTLNTVPADFANRPRILVENVFQLGTVTASSENGADNGWLENAIDGLTFDAWEWSSTPAWLSVTLTTAQPVDMCAIGLHTGLTFVFQYYDGSAWVDLHDAVTTTTTAVHAVIFTEVTASQFRIYISDAADENILGIVMLGKSIQLPKTFYGGHAPIVLNRTTQIVRNRTENGFDAGVYSLRTGASTSVSIDNIKPSWIRENIEDLNKKLEICPFIFAWRPSTYPNDVAYCWLNSPIKASNNGTRDYMSLNFDVQAFIGGGIAAPIVESMFIGMRNSPFLALYQDVETDMIETSASGIGAATNIFASLDAHPRGIVAGAFYDDGIVTYDYRSGAWTELDQVDSGLDATQFSVSIHPDNAKWLLISTGLPNVAKLYRRITKPDLTNRYYLKSTSTVNSSYGKFSPDGALIATASLTALKIYTFNSAIGGISVSATDYGVGQFVRCISWSATGEYLAVTCDFNSPRLKIFKRNMSTNALTELTIDEYWPKTVTSRAGESGNANNLAWHPSDDYLAIGSDSDGSIYIYQNNGDDTFSDVTDTIIDEQPGIGSRIFAIQWSTTGNRLYSGHQSSGTNHNLAAYSFDGTNLTKLYTTLVGDSGTEIGDMKYVRFVGAPTVIPPDISAEIFLYDSLDALVTLVIEAGTYTIAPTITTDPVSTDFDDVVSSVSFYVDDVLIETVTEAPFETDFAFTEAMDGTTKTFRVDVLDAYGDTTTATKAYLFEIYTYTTFTLDSSKTGAGITLSAGDLTATYTTPSGNQGTISARTRTTGKYYFKINAGVTFIGAGFARYSSFNVNTQIGGNDSSLGLFAGSVYYNNSTLSSGHFSYTSGVYYLAIDMDNYTISFYDSDGDLGLAAVDYSGYANMADQALAPAISLQGGSAAVTLENGTANDYTDVPAALIADGYKPWDLDDL